MKLTYGQEIIISLFIAFVAGTCLGAAFPEGSSYDAGNLDIKSNLTIASNIVAYDNITYPWNVGQVLIPPFTYESIAVDVNATNATGELQVNITKDNQLISSNTIKPGNTINSESQVGWFQYSLPKSDIDVTLQAVGNDTHMDFFILAYSHHVTYYYLLTSAISMTLFVAFFLFILSIGRRLGK